MWERAARAGPGATGSPAWLRAAGEDIRAAQAEALGGIEPLLALRCGLATGMSALEVRVAARGRPPVLLVLPAADLRAAVFRGTDPLAVVAHAFVARDRPLPPADQLGLAPHAPPRIPAAPDAAGADLAARITAALAAKLDVVVVGDEGSGKAVSAARAARLFSAEGGAAVWIDLRAGAKSPPTVVWELLRLPRHDRVLVVVSRRALVAGFQDTRTIISRLRHAFDLDLRLLTTDTPSAVAAMPALYGFYEQVPVRQPVAMPGQDAAVMYWFACLGLFGIQPLVAVADRRYHPEQLHRLQQRELIHLTAVDGQVYYRLGAGVTPTALVAGQAGLPGRAAPGELIWAYLKMAGADAGRAPLEQLDLVGFPGRDGHARVEGSRNLTFSWELLYRLGEQLDRYCATNPDWDDNVGAAVFAAEALAELGHAEQWRRVAGFVRGRLSYDVPGELPRATGGPTLEEGDFARIQANMIAEDAFLGARWPAPLLGTGIDKARFHSTWMLGVLLGFEGSALERSPGRLDALLATAQRHCAADGHFYPRRVPWVTARIVLGLCGAGLTYATDDVVRRACDWLVRPVREGGAYAEWWKGGTGSWNRDEATTAMCVVALLRAGAPAGEEVGKAVVWLRSRVGEWTRPGREIDLALALEAILLGAHDWQSSYGRLLNLLSWANEEFRGGLRDLGLPEGTLRAPFAAAQLAALVRVAVSREAAALVEPAAPAAERRPAPVEPRLPAAAGMRLRPSVTHWREVTRQIEEQLEAQVQRRRAVLRRAVPGGMPIVQAAYDQYTAQLALCRELREQLRERTPADVVERLIELGDTVCGTGWNGGLSYDDEAWPR
ncbi:prenyltransferase/squalene oxidase repeat-containing protein [Actinoplanes sp. RD1]|uniref:hypothetical protein n=1 Tax=Actinoplanes sp. RD1 TaxID=3064538 RepID=UPI0027406782|nr:hypothetical protein [Actinoplanes sp. RD1]